MTVTRSHQDLKHTATRYPLYHRPASLKPTPTHFCPGCGHGTVHKLIAETLDGLGIRGKTVGVAPVGCAVLAYNYLDCDISEAAHGRAAAVATGIKRCLPDRIVFAYQGDGDLAAIGMGETIHAANRGEHIAIIFVNNTVYGMTGGQMAPTTLIGQKTATCPCGRDQVTTGAPIKICELLNTLKAPWHIERVALDGPSGVRRTRKALLTAFQAQVDDKGYSFIEILSPCPIHMRCSPVEAIRLVKERMIPYFPLGILRQNGQSMT
jgi:2-oxoglutarate ferredoxin oxidoreductase subunit beta